MASYYYLAASLTDLKFDAPLPNTTEDFLASCRFALSSKHYRLVEACAFGHPIADSSHPFIAAWNQFDRVFTASLVVQRSLKLKKDVPLLWSEQKRDKGVDEAVKEALLAANPLEMELALMKLAWQEADRLKALKVFELEVFLAYAIQLRILERKALFVQASGEQEFKRLFVEMESHNRSI